MDHNLSQAIDHINKQDKTPYEYDYTCNCCGDGFDKGHGIEVTEEKFCSECVSDFKHHDFYQDSCGLSVRQTNILIEENTINL